MNKGICILLSSALLMGTVPVYGDMAEVEQVTHTYRAEVGTKNFYKDDVLQTLDTEIYLKDGYVMLPVRTFFTAVDENAKIIWDREKQFATVWMGEYRILLDVLDTPISPELLPPDKDGKINQKTEDLVGPYELHDFFLFHILRFGFRPAKVLYLAEIAFDGSYDRETLLKWLKNFYRRFFVQQFKRSCLPDGPKVGALCLSPRSDWRMPSDAFNRVWMEEVEKL